MKLQEGCLFIKFNVDGLAYKRSIKEKNGKFYVHFDDERWELEELAKMIEERHGRFDIVK